MSSHVPVLDDKAAADSADDKAEITNRDGTEVSRKRKLNLINDIPALPDDTDTVLNYTSVRDKKITVGYLIF